MKEAGARKVSQSRPRRRQGVTPLGGSVSFVITLWSELREVEAEPEWRWRVTHVQTGEQAYFRWLSDVLAFITAESGLPAPQ